MAAKYLTIGAYVLIGALVGSTILIVAVDSETLSLDRSVAIVDLLGLALTIGLALYIPLGIERLRDRSAFRRELIFSSVRQITSRLGSLNTILKSCAVAGSASAEHLMAIRTEFLGMDIALSALERKIIRECSSKCRATFTEVKADYMSYHHAVTGGSLYGDRNVPWGLWRAQELAYFKLNGSIEELMGAMSNTL